MPALPTPPTRGRRRTPLTDPVVAQSIVLVLEGRSNLNGQANGAQLYVHFARAVREYLLRHPSVRRQFERWYESL